ncbi:MAG: PHP domain-containing protein, partial [Patescibacteria group bacterium]
MFVHLHNHTHFSLLDGLTRPKEAVNIAKAHDMPAMGITDHGVLYGAIEFYKEAKKNDINPIIGCEMYIAPFGRLRKEPGLKINHLTVLAYNNEGYQNLIALVTKAHLEGFYYKPRVDHGLLREFHRGLIALSGCVASEVSEAILAQDEEKALEKIRMYQEIFGKENFFLEIMDHPEMQEQIVIRSKLGELARATKAPLVATNDNHYALKEDRDAHDILLCIQTGKTIHDENRMQLDGNYSIRTPQEMREAFSDTPEACDNTLEIAKRVNVEIQFG